MYLRICAYQIIHMYPFGWSIGFIKSRAVAQKNRTYCGKKFCSYFKIKDKNLSKPEMSLFQKIILTDILCKIKRI